jgi:hypothetical protein
VGRAGSGREYRQVGGQGSGDCLQKLCFGHLGESAF